MRRALPPALFALALSGCPATENTVLTTRPDVARADTPPADRAVTDAATPPRDNGAPPADVMAPTDIFTPPVDSGPTPFDAGAPDVPPPPPPPPPPDVPMAFDAGFAVLGDAHEAPPDVADTRPRDTSITIAGTASDAASRFGGSEDPSRAPSFVYPTDGTILPPNLVGFEVHYRPGTGNDLFEFSFVGSRGTVRVYTRCAVVADGCALSLDTAGFAELARVAQPAGDLRVSLRGTSAAASGRYGSAAARTLGIASTDVRGGLYYWAASSGSILRYEFGRPGARPELYVGGDPINCQGCHTLARNGQRAAIGRFIPGPAITRILDVPTRRSTSPEFGTNFATFSPDNTRLLSSDGARLALLDGYTSAGVPGLAAGTPGTMPDWSRNGRMVVFARPRSIIPLLGSPGHNGPADLLTMNFAAGAFSAPSPLITAVGSDNYFYPSFSPDDSWVLFNRGAMSSFNAIDAHLYAVRVDRTAAPVRLANADSTGDVGNSWPKWVPFIHSYQGEPLMWLTFSSRRDYGLRLQQQSREAEMRRSQLWMAAFRPNRAASGDPSAPAFWLPFQDMNAGNHIAQWSEAVVRQQCTVDRDCASLQERCALIDGANRCIAR